MLTLILINCLLIMGYTLAFVVGMNVMNVMYFVKNRNNEKRPTPAVMSHARISLICIAIATSWFTYNLTKEPNGLALSESAFKTGQAYRVVGEPHLVYDDKSQSTVWHYLVNDTGTLKLFATQTMPPAVFTATWVDGKLTFNGFDAIPTSQHESAPPTTEPQEQSTTPQK